VHLLSFVALETPPANTAPCIRISYALPSAIDGAATQVGFFGPTPIPGSRSAFASSFCLCARAALYVCHNLKTTDSMYARLQFNSRLASARADKGGGVGSLPTFTALRTALSNVGSECLSLSTFTEQY